MEPITLTAVVDEARRLTIEIPGSIPVGPVVLTITPLDMLNEKSSELTRDMVRQKLAAAGLLGTAHYAPDDAVPLTREERTRLGRLLIGEQSSDALINEDRGPL
ncbi:MAG: hypothetical protein H0X37_27200 [Herpetosiphonaceae bacterium]|nr:hypothetical protein [Herpetosiphonaceae bacterium]